MKSWRAAVPITVYHMEKAVKGESGNILLPFVILLLLFSIFPLGLLPCWFIQSFASKEGGWGPLKWDTRQ